MKTTLTKSIDSLKRVSPLWQQRTLLSLMIVGLLALSFWLMRTLWLRGPAPAYSLIAELTRDGQFGGRFYDDAWFSAQILARTHGAISDIFSPDLPTLPILLLPIALGPVAALPTLWAIANGAALLVAIRVPLAAMRRDESASNFVLVAIIVAALFSPPLREDLDRGQIYAFVLLLHAMVFWALMQNRDTVGGIALGLLWAAKITGLPLWLILLTLRRWRSLAWSAVTIGIAVLITLMLNADVWRVYLIQSLPAWIDNASATAPAYQTVNGFFQHFFRYDAQLNPLPLWDAPGLATILAVVVSSALLGITVARTRHLPLQQALAAGVVLSVCLMPLAEQYHYLILLVPFAVTATLFTQFNFSARVLLVFSVVLVFAPLPFKDQQWWQGVWALLAYPRLYGALILWGLLVWTNSSSALASLRAERSNLPIARRRLLRKKRSQ